MGKNVESQVPMNLFNFFLFACCQEIGTYKGKNVESQVPLNIESYKSLLLSRNMNQCLRKKNRIDTKKKVL